MRPDFALTERNAASVATLCIQLDGLPLAIEMAAARVNLLPPEAMLPHLAHRLAFLRGDQPDRPDRHRNLRAALDWSHELLTPAARALLRRLAVFVDGASLAAVEAVCAGGAAGPGDERADPIPAFLGALGELADSSLVRQDPGANGEVRATMLATIREYAAELLDASGERETIAARHARFFLALAEETRGALARSGQRAALAAQAREMANFRAALEAFSARGETEAGLRLAVALQISWLIAGPIGEGTAWMARFYADGDAAMPPELRARALGGLSTFASALGAEATALARAAASIEIARGLAHPGPLFNALTSLGNLHTYRGEWEPAEAALGEALGLARAHGHAANTVIALCNCGLLAFRRGDHSGALARYTESITMARAGGDLFGLPFALANLAAAQLLAGEATPARRALDEAVRLCQQTSNWQVLSLCLLSLGELARRAGRFRRAVTLLGAVEGLRRETGFANLYPEARETVTRLRTEGRAMLGEADCDTLLATARALGRDELLAFAPAEGEDDALAGPPAAPGIALSRREREILPLVARGLTNRAIADALYLSAHRREPCRPHPR